MPNPINTSHPHEFYVDYMSIMQGDYHDFLSRIGYQRIERNTLIDTINLKFAHRSTRYFRTDYDQTDSVSRYMTTDIFRPFRSYSNAFGFRSFPRNLSLYEDRTDRFYVLLHVDDYNLSFLNLSTDSSNTIYRVNEVVTLETVKLDNAGVCGHCGAIVEQEELDDNNDICSYCEDHMSYCEDCEERVPNDEIHSVYDRRFNMIHVCECCRDDNYCFCNYCDEHVHPDNYTHSLDMCDRCAEDHTECAECNSTISMDDAYRIDDDDDCEDYYCRRCYNEKTALPYRIREYNYRPDLVEFFKHPTDDQHTRRFYGIELEVDRGGTNAQVVNKLGEITGDYTYFKRDGSLDNGFEIVSHPCTLNTHLYGVQWGELMKELINVGYRSHDSRTCGLHIHIDRRAFGEFDDADRMNIIARFLWLFEQYEDELFRFSRRTRESWRRWTRGFNDGDEKKSPNVPRLYRKAIDKNIHGSRYHVVNMQNRNTVEVRLFRGTLLLKTFQSTLLLVDALVNVALDTDINVYRLTWDKFKDQLPNNELYNNLKSYMAERGI